jgi:dihydrofolate reductase
MRKIVAGLFVSLDGVVEMPEQSILPYFDGELVEVIQSDQDEADTILLGRRTYQEFAAYWPGKSAADDPFADYINRTPKLVVSTTLKTVDWRNTTLIADGVVDELIKRKRHPGKNISIAGSATLVRSLLLEGLVDELRLLVFPIVVASGKHLFDGWAEQMPMRLVASRALSTGVLALVYEPAEPQESVGAKE